MLPAPPDQWVASKRVVHDPLIDEEAFDRVQDTLTRRARTGTAPQRTYRSRHPYVFKSLIRCGVCGRKMQGQHSHGVAYYGSSSPMME